MTTCDSKPSGSLQTTWQPSCLSNVYQSLVVEAANHGCQSQLRIVEDCCKKRSMLRGHRWFTSPRDELEHFTMVL
jgi:hypothetical protein